MSASVETEKGKEKEKSVLELLEEDDEFEEFEGTNWEDVKAEQVDEQLWQVVLLILLLYFFSVSEIFAGHVG